MPQERSDMRRVKEVLRLAHELGYSNRQIQKSVRMGRTSVGVYLARARDAGVRYADVAGMGEAEVEALLFKRPEPAVLRPMPDWAEVAAELRKPAVTLQLVWQEYRDQHADGYSYSQYVTAKFMLRLPGESQGCRLFPRPAPQHKTERPSGYKAFRNAISDGSERCCREAFRPLISTIASALAFISMSTSA